MRWQSLVTVFHTLRRVQVVIICILSTYSCSRPTSALHRTELLLVGVFVLLLHK
jgi:hypothetical protein